MNTNNQMEEIKNKCDDILCFDMWSDFHESFFWPLISLLDINSKSIIYIYECFNDQGLDVLLHDKVINPLIESTQSNELVNYLSVLKKNNPAKIDDVLIHDAELNLFSSYSEDASLLFVDNFNSLYMTLKSNVFNMMGNFLSIEEQKLNLNVIKKYMEDNSHEFFSYVHVYWLCLYIHNFVDEQLKNTYRDSLGCFFPRARL